MSNSLLTNETSEFDLLDQRPFDAADFDILKSYGYLSYGNQTY